MGEFKKKAFDGALDLVKQLITLSTGVLALSGTFIKDFAGMVHGRKADAPTMVHCPNLLFIGWGVLLISILFGVLAHGAIVGTMNKIVKDDDPKNGLYMNKNVKFYAAVQWLSFLAGIIIIVIFCGREA